MGPKKAAKTMEDSELQDKFECAMRTIDDLQETVNKLESEKTRLLEEIQDKTRNFQRENDDILHRVQRNSTMYEQEIAKMKDKIRDLQDDMEVRDVNARDLRGRGKYDVPLPQQVLYDGNGSYVAFMRQFCALADQCKWDNQERAFRLINCLRGEAAEFVFSQVGAEAQSSYVLLESALEARFMERRSAGSYLTELEGLKLNSRGKLVEYVANIKRLVRHGYPTADQRTVGTICLRHFIKGLGDPQMALAVGMKDPQTIDEAREILETYYSLQDETKPVKVRMVKQQHQKSNGVTQSEFESFKTSIQESMEKQFEEILSLIKENQTQEKKAEQQKPFKKRDLSTVECFKCHKFGHYARDCVPVPSEPFKSEEDWGN